MKISITFLLAFKCKEWDMRNEFYLTVITAFISNGKAVYGMIVNLTHVRYHRLLTLGEGSRLPGDSGFLVFCSQEMSIMAAVFTLICFLSGSNVSE